MNIKNNAQKHEVLFEINHRLRDPSAAVRAVADVTLKQLRNDLTYQSNYRMPPRNRQVHHQQFKRGTILNRMK